MRLLGYSLSPNHQRARFALEELGIPYEDVPVDIMSGEHRKPDYLAKNAAGRVPLLEDGDLQLSESNAIVLHVASKKPESPLLGRSPAERAEIHRWMFFVASHISPAFVQLFFHMHLLPQSQRVAGLPDAVKKALEWELNVLDKRLAASRYLAGEDFTLADVCGVPDFGVTPILGVDLAPHANLRRWLGEVRERPAWKRVAPMSF